MSLTGTDLSFIITYECDEVQDKIKSDIFRL